MAINQSESHQKLMALALEEANSAHLRGEVPVGAIIAVGDKIVAKASNRTEELADPTAHAEVLALRAAASTLQDWRLEDATLYVTLEPCTMCAGAIRAARIKTVVFGARDQRLGACGSLYDILTDSRLGPEPRVIEGVLKVECQDILKKFFDNLRKDHNKR